MNKTVNGLLWNINWVLSKNELDSMMVDVLICLPMQNLCNIESITIEIRRKSGHCIREKWDVCCGYFSLALDGWIAIIDFNIILKDFKGFIPKGSQSEFHIFWIQIDLLWKSRPMYGK